MSEQLVIEKGAFTIKGWCAYRGYSVATFYKMRKNGVAPKVTQPPGAPPRITLEADRDWLTAANNPKGKIAAEAEQLAEQRQHRARKAAARAIESERHVSRRRVEVA